VVMITPIVSGVLPSRLLLVNGDAVLAVIRGARVELEHRAEVRPAWVDGKIRRCGRDAPCVASAPHVSPTRAEGAASQASAAERERVPDGSEHEPRSLHAVCDDRHAEREALRERH
jgi:hypothetical protein